MFSHDIMNYQTACVCYLPQPSASADYSDPGFNNTFMKKKNLASVKDLWSRSSEIRDI